MTPHTIPGLAPAADAATSRRTSRTLSRRTLLAGGAGLALAGSALSSALPAEAAASTRVASYNISVTSTSQVRADLNTLADNVTLIGLNEVMALKREGVESWVGSRPSWGWWRPAAQQGESRFKGSNAVLFNQQVYRLNQKGAVFGSRSRTPTFDVDQRWITWVDLTHRGTGTRIVWIQTHMDPAVEQNGRPREGAEARIEGNLIYMNRLLDLVRRKSAVAEVLVGGDWNVDARADHRVGFAKFPFAVLEKRKRSLPALRSTYSQFGFGVPATEIKSGTYLDNIALWRQAGGTQLVRFTDHNVRGGLSSNHRPVIAGLAIGEVSGSSQDL